MTAPLTRIVVITGPTASGKSKLALQIATRLNGTVVNADSVQIYAGADIGSAKPTPQEMDRTPHLLFSELLPSEPIDAARFSKLAEHAIAKTVAAGRIPIVTGGTGLYLKALLHGMVPLSEHVVENSAFVIPSDATPSQLYQILSQIDPETAQKLEANDQVRVERALKIYQQTGSLPSDLRKKHAFKDNRYAAYVIVCFPEREKLYEEIDLRTRGIVAAGLVEEARRIANQFGENSHVLKAIGYKEALGLLRGELDLVRMTAEIAKNTRRLAKRQYTWWRNEPAKMGWTTSEFTLESTENIFQELSIFLSRGGALAEDRIYVRFFDPYSNTASD